MSNPCLGVTPAESAGGFISPVPVAGSPLKVTSLSKISTFVQSVNANPFLLQFVNVLFSISIVSE